MTDVNLSITGRQIPARVFRADCTTSNGVDCLRRRRSYGADFLSRFLWRVSGALDESVNE